MIATQRIEVADDLHLDVATAGPLDASPVLFVHGNGPNWQQFVPQFESFGDRYRLIAPSLRGDGRSQAPGAPTVEDFTIARLPPAEFGHPGGGTSSSRPPKPPDAARHDPTPPAPARRRRPCGRSFRPDPNRTEQP